MGNVDQPSKGLNVLIKYHTGMIYLNIFSKKEFFSIYNLHTEIVICITFFSLIKSTICKYKLPTHFKIILLINTI